MRGSTALRRLTAGALLCTLTSCMTVRTLPDSARFVSERRPVRIAVIMKDGSERTLEAPAVFQDSLVGLDRQGRPASIAVQDVDGVRVRQPSVPRTVALVAGLAVGFTFLVLAGGGTGARPDPTEEPPEDHRMGPLPVSR